MTGRVRIPRWLAALSAILAARAALDAWLLARAPMPFLISPTEVARTLCGLDWSSSPSVSPGLTLYWLPLQFYVEGILFRIWREPWIVPTVISVAASLTSLALLYALSRELGLSEGAALAASAAACVDGPAVLMGVGGSADPLMHAAALASFLAWARHSRTEKAFDFRAACALYAVGNAVRFELWIFAAAFSFYALRRNGARAIPGLCAVWAFPVFWSAYSWARLADPLFFLNATLATEIRGHRAFGWLIGDSINGWLEVVSPTLVALALAGVASLRSPARLWYAGVVGAMFAAFALASPKAMVYVDYHHDLFVWLLLPPAAAAVSAALGALEASRRRWCAAALAAGFLVLQGYQIATLARDAVDGRRMDVAAAARRVVQWRRAGRLEPGDGVLVELPEGPRRGLNENSVWRLAEADLPVSFDRRFEKMELNDGGAALKTEGNPSVLDQNDSCASLSARRARVVAAQGHAESLKRCGYAPEWRSGPVVLWMKPS